MQLEIPSCLGYGPQSFNLHGFDAQAKIIDFYQLFCHLITRINVILSGIYLESWLFWLGGGVQKTSRKRLK